MPVLNCQNTLAITVRSILWQTHSDWELLLIDDGSTDGTPRIAKQFEDSRIHVHSDGTSQGLPARLNQAISLSKGPYFARMDGDDVAYPKRLENQLSFLRDHPAVDLVGTSVLVFGRNGKMIGKRAGPAAHEAICANPRAGFPLVHPTFMGRLDWFKKWRYDIRTAGACDQDLLLRSFSRSRFANLPDILQGYREESIHLGKIIGYRKLFAASLYRYFARKRPVLAARAVLEQVFKGVIDCSAVHSGLNHRLLRHRAKTISQTEQEQWEAVWRRITSACASPYA
jgi:glycosyltransferase involved in cell wall biosynthesis